MSPLIPLISSRCPAASLPVQWKVSWAAAGTAIASSAAVTMEPTCISVVLLVVIPVVVVAAIAATRHLSGPAQLDVAVEGLEVHVRAAAADLEAEPVLAGVIEAHRE